MDEDIVQTKLQFDVENMERIYSAYLDKITRNEKWARQDPENFGKTLNEEYGKARKSKSKKMQGLERLPVRMYGSGDYIPEHYEWLKVLDFNFYIISKSLTWPNMETERDKLQKLDNLTSIVLSFDNQNISKYDEVSHLYNTDGYQFAFTGMADDFLIQRDFNGRNFNIFFNIGEKKEDKQASAAIKQRCPSDSGQLPLQKSCATCNKCWRSSKTQGHQEEWNAYTIA